MSFSKPGRPVTGAVAALVLLGAILTLVAYLLGGTDRTWAINGAWMTLSVACAVAVASARGRAAVDTRSGWTLVLLGVVLWTIGEALWIVFMIVPAPTVPSIADLCWYGFAILTAVGLFRIGDDSTGRRLVAAEVAPLSIAGYALVGALVWEKLEASSLGVAEKAAALAYPVIFVAAALAVLQLVTSRDLRVGDNPGLIAIVAGFTLEAAAFVWWCPALLDGNYVAGTHPADLLWSLGLVAIAIGACFAGPVAVPAAAGRGRFAALLPGVMLASLFGVQIQLILSGAAWVPRMTLACAVAIVSAFLLVRAHLLNREQSEALARERQATADAHAARRDLDGFFTLSVGLLGLADFDGMFRRLNPAWGETLGWSTEELLAKPFLDFIHPDDVARTLGEMSSLSSGQDTLSFENRYRCKDGTYRWLAWKCRPDLDAGVIYAAAHDVTNLRHLSAELAAARDAAVEASRHKSEFLAMMSHEIRTPLNGVIGMTHLLAQTALDDEQAAYVKTVGSSGDALLTIIDDILDFSKIEAGQVELDLVDFDVRDLVESVGDQFAARFHEKELELVLDLPDDLPTVVHADPTRMRQVLTNLIGNALKFTPSGEIVVGVRLESGDGGSPALRFTVRDTGIGVDPADLPRLFDSFTQADSSTTRRFGGSGLGLAICKRLTERMGGEIGATSEPGEGSTFWFTLRPERIRARVDQGPPRDLAGLRVLVVDDNAANREILEHQLRAWRMRPASAHDGPSALRGVREAAERGEPYDLLLLDFHMPGMNGVELASGICADPELAGVPMVLLTSSAGAVAGARRAGIKSFLTKPVRQSHLFDTIADALAGLPAAAPAVVAAAEPEPPAAAARPRVLVAEDNAVNQTVATITLRKRGYDVEIAPDGEAAVEMASAGAYALIFMDCQMPGLDGYDATRAIRREEVGHRTPIVAMTASAMRGDRDLCLAAGMDDYLSKPLRPDDLDRVLEEWAAV